MKQMGIQQQELDALQVIIRTEDKEYIFDQPEVSKINMMGQDTYQVVGTPRVEEVSQEVTIDHDDIQTVMEQANVSEDAAKDALIKTNGDLAEAIMNLAAQKEE